MNRILIAIHMRLGPRPIRFSRHDLHLAESFRICPAVKVPKYPGFIKTKLFPVRPSSPFRYKYHTLSSLHKGSVPVLKKHLIFFRYRAMAHDAGPHDPNIDSSLTLNSPTGVASPADTVSQNLQVIEQPPDQSFLEQEDTSAQLTHQVEQSTQQQYTPARLFQATGDVRSLSRSDISPSGFSVQIYDRHVHSWIPDINFSDIAIRGQLYILWKTAWQERTSPIDRDAILEAAALTLKDIEKDNKKWERNYSAARRRDWHPNFTAFYDDVFKGQWPHKIWPSQGALPEPPRFLAEMARKLTKNAGVGAGMSIHQPGLTAGEGEASMSPVALRTLKLRVIELEGINQALREDLERNEEARRIVMQENTQLKAQFDEIRQKINIS